MDVPFCAEILDVPQSVDVPMFAEYRGVPKSSDVPYFVDFLDVPKSVDVPIVKKFIAPAQIGWPGEQKDRRVSAPNKPLSLYASVRHCHSEPPLAPVRIGRPGERREEATTSSLESPKSVEVPIIAALPCTCFYHLLPCCLFASLPTTIIILTFATTIPPRRG